ncbi:MAG TPA: hypothetical protein GX012_01435 [Acholeplasma sp.]|nr:hypothetical protein [Acholeplasma sp.]
MFLAAQPESSRVEIEQHLNIEKTKLLRRINEHIRKGIIVKIGNGSSTIYSLS